MSIKMITVVMAQILLACVPLNSMAVVLDRAQQSHKQWNVDRELFQGCRKHRDVPRAKGCQRSIVLKERGRILARFQQRDLLQELLTQRDIRHESAQLLRDNGSLRGTSYKNKEQETGMLEELLEEKLIE
jgi:hypothetical protein